MPKLTAAEVAVLDPYKFIAVIGKTVIHPDGQVFLGQVCRGMVFDTADAWVQIYSSAGLTDVETQTGPFEMMTPRGFLADEGPARSLAIMTQVAARPASIRKMAWLTPWMAKAVPYLGYILVTGQKPRQQWPDSPQATP